MKYVLGSIVFMAFASATAAEPTGVYLFDNATCLNNPTSPRLAGSMIFMGTDVRIMLRPGDADRKCSPILTGKSRIEGNTLFVSNITNSASPGCKEAVKVKDFKSVFTIKSTNQIQLNISVPSCDNLSVVLVQQ